MDPLVDSTGHPYAYAGDNPANNTDPSGKCDSGTFIVGGLCDAAKAVLRQAVDGLNGALTSFAQSDFSNGVNDAVLAFALSVQNLPAQVHGLISGVLAHPENAIPLLKSLLLTAAESLGPLQILQVAKALIELVGQLKAQVDCKGLGYTAGYALTSFILKFALADATAGLGKLAAEALAEGITAGKAVIPHDPRVQSNSAKGRFDTSLNSFDRALQLARKYAGDLGDHTIKLYDPETGTLIGEQTPDKTRGWRIDHDHVNWWNWSAGKKGSGGTYGHVFYPKDQVGPHQKYPGYGKEG